MTESSTKNYYEILEINTDANHDQVYAGYLKTKNAYSEDNPAIYSLMGQDECKQMTQLIDEAYSIISDPTKRQRYDKVKGFTTEYKINSTETKHKENDFETLSNSIVNDKAIPQSTKKNITKIVASSKYSLSYEVNQEFENEIEKATEYSGSLLKQIREYKKVEIQRMSEMTRVSKSYLLNIENENIEKLPALVYVRGFVYQYAKCLKLNPELVATSYLFRLKKIKELL